MAVKKRTTTSEINIDVKYIVIERFANKDNISEIYEVGQDVSHFDEQRLNNLIERKLIEIVQG